MDLKQLEYFVRVAELSSFTRASDLLNIAQPALSRQVRLLEVELRQNLLVRNGRGVTLTDAGRLLLELSLGILHQVERTHEELSRLRGGLAGHVVLGLPPGLSKLLLVPITRAFRARLPEASLSISEGLFVAMQEGLIAGRLDIALLYNHAYCPDIELTPLLDQDLYLVARQEDAAPSAPVSLAELAELSLIMPSRPNAIRMLLDSAMANVGRKPRICLEIDSISGILDLVKEGVGSAVLSRTTIASQHDPHAYLLRPIVEPRLSCKLSIALSSRRPISFTQKVAMEVIRETILSLLPANS